MIIRMIFPGDKFDENIEVLESISNDTVFTGRKRDTGEPVVIKVESGTKTKKRWLPGAEKWVLAEVLNLRKVRGVDHCVQIDSAYSMNNRGTTYIVMKTGSNPHYELGECISAGVELTERDMQDVMLRLVKTNIILRNIGLYHVDQKPGNLLLEEDDDGNYIPMIIDFGSCVNSEKEVYINPPLSTFYPPEGEHTWTGDGWVVWELGVILHYMSEGFYPSFESDGTKNPPFQKSSPKIRQLLRAMFSVAPKRISLDELARHPWILGDISNTQNYAYKPRIAHVQPHYLGKT